ncbi:hypothetical protein Hanom_Chr16g01431081 [Helianthus anomalus]
MPNIPSIGGEFGYILVLRIYFKRRKMSGWSLWFAHFSPLVSNFLNYSYSSQLLQFRSWIVPKTDRG